MQLTTEQAMLMRKEIKRTFYAATKLRMSGDTAGHMRLVAAYCRRMTDEFDMVPIMSMSFLAGAGMDACVDLLGECAEQDLSNALFELELDGE